MTQAFDDMAASRPKPIVYAPHSYFAAMFQLMRHDDKWGYTEMRDEMAAHLQRKTRQRQYPVDTPPNS